MKRGFIYVLINPAMPDLVKIGKTTRLSSDRAREIESEFRSITGLPYGFRVAYDWEVADCDRAERFIHSQLSYSKAHKEWYELSLRNAIDKVGKLILENELDYNSLINKLKLHLEIADNAFENDNFEEAIKAYREIIDIGPHNENIVAKIAICESFLIFFGGASLQEIAFPLKNHLSNYSNDHPIVLYYLCLIQFRSNLWEDLETDEFSVFCEELMSYINRAIAKKVLGN